MDGVKFLGFDVFGTVVDWRSSVARELRPFLERHGLAQLDPAAFADEWRGMYQPSMDPIRRGARPWTRLSVLHRENLETVLGRHGIDAARVGEAELAAITRAWERLDPWPDSVPGLTRLKTRFALGTISNGNIGLMMWLARHGGLPWDVIAGAEATRTYKPQPETYLGTADLLGLQPGECALVAAHNDDLAAARACGFKTAFIPRPAEHGPGQSSDLAAEEAWDVVAEDLTDLARRLGC
ncbi:MAG: haloacid dehalogenase type II [Acetobacteraceae bacterium]|nr:haloacid dehalogenase type II [Acetobacteraceae bacterium]